MGKFNFKELKGHDLYHLRYGKGAIIVAIPKEDPEQSEIEWNQFVQDINDEIENKLDPIIQKRQKLEEELRELKMKLRKAEIEKSQDNINEHKEVINRVQNWIDSLDQKQKNINELYKPKREITNKRFFPHLNLAMFYTHNISHQSDLFTRFDKIISIEESSGFVTVILKFSDSLQERHNYHSRVHWQSKSTASKNRRVPGPIEGAVKRIIPVENVTLEMVSRLEYSG